MNDLKFNTTHELLRELMSRFDHSVFVFESRKTGTVQIAQQRKQTQADIERLLEGASLFDVESESAPEGKYY